MPAAPSKVRKLISANTYVEGWAPIEQMMIDEGYGGGDLKLRLGPYGCIAARRAICGSHRPAYGADDFRAGSGFLREGRLADEDHRRQGDEAWYFGSYLFVLYAG